MKNMFNNKLSIYLLLCLCFSSVISLSSQTRESFAIPLSNPGATGKLVVHIIDGSISVKGYDGDEVVVEAIGNEKSQGWKKYKNREVRNGMKKIAENSLSFSVEEVNNQVYVRYQPGKWVIDFEIRVPRNFSVDLKTINKGDIAVEGAVGAHEVSNTNGKVTMINVGGSVIADALNKNITVSFSEIHDNTAMMFSSLNGDVDVSFPKNLKADIMARSDNGSVFSDFEITKTSNAKNVKTTQKNGVYRVKREKGVSGSINGGGADITFKTLNGDILIRENL